MSAEELQIKIKAMPCSRIAVELKIPSKLCQTSYDESLSRLARSIKIPGFRKGKVPKAVILQQIGTSRIRASALEVVIEKAWKEALQKEDLQPLCEPEIQGGIEGLFETFQPNSPLTVTLETDILPTPNLKKTSGLKATAESTSFDKSKVEDLIEQSRKQLATLVPVDNRPAAMGDVAVVNFQGTYCDDGSKIKGGSAESMDIDLEEGRMIPGFVEGIVGMQLNNKKSLECSFPDDYQEEEARGRKAKFEIELKDLKVRELPNLDDDFARQASDKNTLDELRQELEKRLIEDVERRNMKNRREALMNALIDELEVELPRTLINQEVRNIVEQTAQEFAQQGMDVKSIFTPELVKSLMESSQEDASKNLKRNLAIQELAKKENIEVSEEELTTRLTTINKQLSSKKNIDPKQLKAIVREEILQDKVYTWLEENNNCLEEKSSSKSDSDKTKTKPKSTKENQKVNKP